MVCESPQNGHQPLSRHATTGSYLRLVRLIHCWRQGVWQAQPAQLDVGYAAPAAQRVAGAAAARAVLRCALLRCAVRAAVPQRWDLQRQHFQEGPQSASASVSYQAMPHILVTTGITTVHRVIQSSRTPSDNFSCGCSRPSWDDRRLTGAMQLLAMSTQDFADHFWP